MIVAVVLGAVVGLGATIAARAMTSHPMALGRELARLDHSADASIAWPSSRPHQRVRAIAAGKLGRRVERDLAVVERSPLTHAAEKLTCGAGLAAVAVCVGVLISAFGVHVTAVAVVVALLTCGAIGYGVPDALLRAAAERRRAALRHALSSYLDLVNVLLAGGAGVETALSAAADAGDGWAFTQIRHAVVWSRSTRRSPWDCFADLGERMGVDELVEIAASVRLAGEHGARIKLSLAAKASALRAHQSARIEADANAATERMGLPTVLLFVGFMVLLGYPAMRQIVGAL